MIEYTGSDAGPGAALSTVRVVDARDGSYQVVSRFGQPGSYRLRLCLHAADIAGSPYEYLAVSPVPRVPAWS